MAIDIVSRRVLARALHLSITATVIGLGALVLGVIWLVSLPFRISGMFWRWIELWAVYSGDVGARDKDVWKDS